MKKTFDITGMTCAACAAHVERAVKKLDGVNDVQVSLLLNRMTVQTDVPDEQIIAAVQSVGYGASASGVEKTDAASTKTATAADYGKTLLWRVILSFVFLIPLMYFSMGHMAGFPLGALDPHKNPASFALIQLVLTTPVLIINSRFFVSGVKSVLHKSANMDTLVSLGSGAAYIYGVVLMFVINAQVAAGDIHAGAQTAMSLFFESAATILALVTLGKFLEAKSKGKTRSEVDKLLRLRPQTATVIRDGAQQTIAIDDIAVGDIVVVMPGEYIPCDGVITAGSTTLDKSAITGESMPEEATVGSKATSAVLNITGRVEMRAESVGSDTTLSKIVELIENAGGSKAPIQKIADKVSAVFVPAVCVISLVTLVVWLIVGTVAQALTMAISVLVISCPCALGLATPVAVMAGTGRAAAHGVLVKNAEVLQGIRSVEIFALDKTATITEGKPRVTDIQAFGEMQGDLNAVLRIAAALERTSTHPLANAVIAEAEQKNVEQISATDSTYKIGYGMVGSVDGTRYALGGARLMREFGVTVDGDTAATVYLCKKGELLGKITVQDEIRPSSAQAIEQLKSVGARVVMITGDGKEQAKSIAQKAGITEVYCNVLPDGKLKIVEELKAQGKTAMVGDGINDAPALKAADVGIAIGSGTDVAIEAADVVLVKSDLSDVPRAMAVSQMTLRNVKQNLFWAFIYNVLGIPLAAGVLYGVGVTLNPMIAAAAMAFSSLFVVCNALRLTVMRFDAAHTKSKLKKIKHVNRVEQSELTINDQGNGGNNMKAILKVNGMSCSHCSGRVQKALQAVSGVTKAEVDLQSGTATVEGEFDVNAAVAAVENAGYECKAE